MNAGRELDAEIAEKVMGLMVQGDNCNLLTADTQQLFTDVAAARFARHFRLAPPMRTPAHYSTSIEAAWQVVERMRERSCDFTLELAGTAWYADFRVNSVVPPADTAPLAICLAALAAVGVPDA